MAHVFALYILLCVIFSNLNSECRANDFLIVQMNRQEGVQFILFCLLGGSFVFRSVSCCVLYCILLGFCVIISGKQFVS